MITRVWDVGFEGGSEQADFLGQRVQEFGRKGSRMGGDQALRGLHLVLDLLLHLRLELCADALDHPARPATKCQRIRVLTQCQSIRGSWRGVRLSFARVGATSDLHSRAWARPVEVRHARESRDARSVLDLKVLLLQASVRPDAWNVACQQRTPCQRSTSHRNARQYQHRTQHDPRWQYRILPSSHTHTR